MLVGVKDLLIGGSFTMCSVYTCGLTSGSSNTQTFCLVCMRCKAAATGCCTALYLLVGIVLCLYCYMAIHRCKVAFYHICMIFSCNFGLDCLLVFVFGLCLICIQAGRFDIEHYIKHHSSIWSTRGPQTKCSCEHHCSTFSCSQAYNFIFP